jgi:hypothetical protein
MKDESQRNLWTFEAYKEFANIKKNQSNFIEPTKGSTLIFSSTMIEQNSVSFSSCIGKK